MTGGLYKITCTANGKIYVGSAKNLQARWKEHVAQLNLQRHFNRHLQRAWTKYGGAAFSYSVHSELGEYDKSKYFAAENALMEQLRSSGFTLFNIAKAEGGWGEETKLRKDEIAAKIRMSLQETLSSMSEEERKGKYGHWKGKSLSQSQRNNLSEYWKGKKKTPKTIERMRIAQSKNNPERRERMSQLGKARRGVTPSTAKSITLNGVTYPSGAAAMKALGINDRQLSRLRKGVTS